MSPRRQAEFVERESELAQLTEALAAATAGSPSVVVVSADAGVGKTRLLSEFASRASTPVLWGSCLPMGGRRLPLGPIVEILRRLQADESTAGRIPPALLPLLSPRDDELETPSVRRSQLFQAVLDLLETSAADAPTVVVIEDLHWADQSTADLLTFLLPNLREQRLLLIVSYRSDGLARDDPLRVLLAEITRHPTLFRLDLAPFTVQQVATQVELLTGERPSREVVDLVYARTHGNAYFVEELVAADGHQGRDLPASLRDLLLVRASGVSAAARRLLGVASLAITDVGEALLADIVDAPIAAVRQQLHELIDAYLLVPTSSGVKFRHALMQEAMQAELLPGERREYHAAYAAALRAGSGEGATGRAAATSQLAHHLQESGNVADAMGAWVAAAAEAEAVAAFAEAHHYLANALAGWTLVDDPVARTGASRLELLTRAAEDAFNGGDSAAATRLVRQALELVDKTVDPLVAGMLHERLSFYLRLTAERDQGFAAMERAMRLVPADPPSVERAHVLAGYAGDMLVRGRLHEAGEASRQAVEMARQVGARHIECRALNTLGVVTIFLENASKGLAQIEAALEMAVTIGDPYQQMRGHWNVMVCAAESGRWERAIAAARRAVTELPRLGYGHQLPEMYSYLQEYFLKLGRFGEARAVADEAAARFPTRLDEALSAELMIALGDFTAAGGR
jgi:tetratricopeptide (TPR) repeat protein